MKQQVILAIDEGTTNCKAILVNKSGEIVSSGSVPVPISHPHAGWVEQDAEQIWTSTLEAISKCLSKVPELEIVAIGISNQRESIVAWNRCTGEPIGPVVTWQCRRTADICDDLKSAGHEERVISLTGLPLDPMFPATKAKWILSNHSNGIDSKDICIGTVDSWLIWKFTNCTVHATDKSNASRTQLSGISEGVWDETLCDLFEIPMPTLPAINDSSFVFGNIQGIDSLPDGIPIASAIGDSHAALFGHGAFDTGDGKITFGTGSSMMATIPEFMIPPAGLTTTIAWSYNGKSTYALEGNILVSASILPWTADLLGLKDVDELFELAQSVENSLGVAVVPALVGLGSPHWNTEAKGLICGLTFPTKPAHIARASVESIVFQVHDIYRIMAEATSHGLGRLFVDGGPSRNSFLMSMVADILDHPILRNESSEESARGAAYLAGLATQFWEDFEEISKLSRTRFELKPDIDGKIRLAALKNWNVAVKRTLFQTAPQERI